MADPRLGRRLLAAARLARWEREIEAAVKRALSRRRAAVEKNALVSITAAGPFDEDEWETDLAEEVAPVVEQVLRELANQVIGTLALDGTQSARVLGAINVRGQLDAFMRLVRGIGPDTASRINEALQMGVTKGEGIAELASRVNDVFAMAERRASLIARTETNRAANATTTDAASAINAELPLVKTWLCVTADTSVRASDVVALARRFYVGPVAVVQTAAMPFGLKVTANHPILTGRGWVRADAITPSDYLVRYCFDEQAPRCPDVEARPASVSQLFDAAHDRGATVGAVRRVVDLDSDRPDGYVDVVDVDGQLRDWIEAACGQPSDDVGLTATDVEIGQLFRDGALRESGVTDRDSDALHGSLASLRAATVSAESPSAQDAGRALVSLLDPGESKHSFDSGLACAESSSESAQRFAAQVERDYVSSVEIVSWCGHVYDLTTRSGWMTAYGGAVIHNSTQDELTREDHADADGQTVAFDEMFEVGGEECEYPCDPVLSAEQACNCRCTVIYELSEDATAEQQAAADEAIAEAETNAG